MPKLKKKGGKKVIKAWAVMREGEIVGFGPAAFAIFGRKSNAENLYGLSKGESIKRVSIIIEN